jgi:hypothetical protein
MFSLDRFREPESVGMRNAILSLFIVSMAGGAALAPAPDAVFDLNKPYDLEIVDRWRGSNSSARAEILDCVCSNRVLGDVTIALTKRKPFDVLAERPDSGNGVSARHSLEPWAKAYLKNFAGPLSVVHEAGPFVCPDCLRRSGRGRPVGTRTRKPASERLDLPGLVGRTEEAAGLLKACAVRNA